MSAVQPLNTETSAIGSPQCRYLAQAPLLPRFACLWSERPKAPTAPMAASHFRVTRRRQHNSFTSRSSPGQSTALRTQRLEVRVLSGRPTECSSVARALGLGPRGRWFESSHSDQLARWPSG